jgi:hypothetical protein
MLFSDMIGLPRGTIRATVLIETITAAFEMEEIIYELRQHSSGLNCGRWDYIFSFIKKFRNHPDKVLPNRWGRLPMRPCGTAGVWSCNIINVLPTAVSCTCFMSFLEQCFLWLVPVQTVAPVALHHFVDTAAVADALVQLPVCIFPVGKASPRPTVCSLLLSMPGLMLP